MPISVFDTELNQEVKVTAAQATSLLKSPRYQVIAEDLPTMRLKSWKGDVYANSPEDFYKIIDTGGRIETEKEATQRLIAEKYSGVGGTLAAVGVGAVDEATLGIGSAFLDATGSKLGDVQDELKQAHPLGYGVGQVLGFTAPAILSGGTSIAAKVAAKTPVGLATRAAEKIGEKALAKALAREMPAGVSGVLQTATKWGLENSAFEAGAQLSEEALGDSFKNGEYLAATGRVLSSAGEGLLVGGAIGGIGKMTADSLKFLANHWRHNISEKALKAGEKMARNPAAKNPERVITNLDGAVKKASAISDAGFTPHIDDIRVSDNFTEQMSRSADLITSLRNDLRATPQTGASRKQIKSFLKSLDATEGYLPNIQRPKDLFRSVKQLSDDAADLAARASTPEAAEHFINIRNNIIDALGDTRVWGQDAGKLAFRQGAIESEGIQSFLGKYFKKIGAGKTINREEYNNLLQRLKANPTEELELWDNYITSQIDRVSSARPQGYRTAVNTLEDLRKEIYAAADHQVGVKLADIIPTGRGGRSAIEREQVDILQSMADKIQEIRGPAALALNMVTGGNFAIAQNTIGTASRIFKGFNALSKKIGGVEGLIDDSAKVIGRGIRPLTRGISLAVNPVETPDKAIKKRRDSQYARSIKIQKILDGYASIIHDPATYQETLMSQIPELVKMVPNIAQSLINTKTRGGGFLLLKASQLGINGNPKKLYTRLSDDKLSKMNRYIDAVENPLRHIRLLKYGVMSAEAAEAIRMVYPTLYDNAINAVTEIIDSRPAGASNHTARQLSVILDYPFDPLYSPDNIRYLQAIHAVAAGVPSEFAGAQSGRPRNITNIKHQTDLRENLLPSQQQEAR